MAADLKVWITADSSKLVKGAAEATKSIESYKNSIQKLRAANKDSSSEESKYISRLKMEAQAVHNSATTREEYVTWTKKLKTQLAYINSMYGKNNSLYQEVYNQLQLNVKALNELDAEQKAAAQSAALLAEKEKAIKELKSYNNDISFKNLTGNSIGAAETELKKYEYMLKTLIKTQGSNSEAAKKMSQVYLDQKDTVAQLKEEQSQYSEKVEDSAKKNESWGTKFTSILKNVILFRTVMMATTKIVNAFKNAISDSVKIAAEAEQIYSKLNTVFDGLSNSASSATTVLSRELGVATSTAANAISTVGDYLQAQGMGAAESLELATEWVSKFKDIMAFKDIDMTLEEFAQSFMSGAAGNLRNFRTFGSIVKESAVNAAIAAKNLGSLTEEEESLQKMITRGTLALEQQSNAWGATKREWDTMLSVSNRLTESFKQWKENLGETLNKGLKPMKSWLTKILDTQNKVSAFYKAFYGNNATVTVRVEQEDDIEESIADALESALGSIFGSDKFLDRYTARIASGSAQIAKMATFWNKDANEFFSGIIQASEGFLTKDGSIQSEALANFASVAYQEFGTSFKQIVKLAKDAGYEISDDIKEKAESLYNRELERIANIEQQEKNLVSLAEQISKIGSYNDNVVATTGGKSVFEWIMGDSFGDKTSAAALLGLNSGTAKENSDTAIKEFASLISTLTDNMADAAVEYKDLGLQLISAENDIAKYGKEIPGGTTLDTESGLSVEEWNNLVQTRNMLVEAREQLSVEYQGWADDIELLQYALQLLYANDSVSSGVKTLSGLSSGYLDSASKIGVTDARALAERDLQDSYAEAVTLARSMGATEDQLKLINDAYVEAGKNLKTYYDQLDKYNAKVERENKLAGYETSTTNYRTQMAQLGMTSDEITRANLVTSLKDARKNGDRELYDSIMSTIVAFDLLQSETKKLADAEAEEAAWQSVKDQAYNMFGDFGTIAKSMATGGFPMADLASILLNIAAGTELVQKISSFLTDYITPVLDSFLQPILPIIETLGGIVQSILQAVLVPLFPIIVEICAYIKLVLGTLEAGLNWVVEGMKWAIGNLAKVILKGMDKLIPGDQSGWYGANTWVGQWSALDPNKNFEKAMKDLLEEVKDIRGLTFDIKNQGEDLSVLDDLRARKIIDSEGYAKALNILGINDTYSATKAEYVPSNTQSTTVSYGDMTFNITSDNADEVTRNIVRLLRANGYEISTAMGA